MRKTIYTTIFSLFYFCFNTNISAQYTWTQKANYPAAKMYGPSGFSIGSKGYVGTGLDDAIQLRKDFWEYDTLTNVWTQKADFGGGPRWGGSAFSIGNFGYLGLGTSAYPSYVWV